ncbi:hypothetical protein M0804_000197 [Polistes exclamans]|nr:hypothetical protein M0804_000197 [Polistes exclamans]
MSAKSGKWLSIILVIVEYRSASNRNLSCSKMKIYVLVSVVLVIATVITAAPYELSSSGEFEPLEEIAEEPLEERATRQRRVTCDLLSAGGFVGDTACAANCLSMGKAGGHCNGSGVCVCRQDSIKDLFDKRFG